MNPTSNLVGKSPWAHQIRQAIRQVAAFRSSVLVAGPSGTGKELIARAIHDQSPRRDEGFVAVDCTSIPPSLFASQLFGHVKGAFSGADCDTLGCFRAADGGTIFLDEIGELNLELQAQLLRVIQQREVIPVGSHRPLPVDIRIVAATNRHLAEEVNLGRFRHDLYYRLNVVRLTTTPLRERPEDVEPLCQHFLARFIVEHGLPTRRLTAGALQALRSFSWPGNVRQLQNVLERLVVFSTGELVDAEQVMRVCEPDSPASPGTQPPGAPPKYGPPNYSPPNDFAHSGSHYVEEAEPAAKQFPIPADQTLPTLAECERELILAALEQSFYNQSAAARLLDIDRKMLARKIRKYAIRVPRSRNGQPAPQAPASVSMPADWN